MDKLEAFLQLVNGIVWGEFMLALILGAGLYLTLGLRFMPIRKLGTGFRLLVQKSSDVDKITGKTGSEGEIAPFNALMTSLSATIGTGNIAGVATAIFLGGPGALFWMWCTALLGMATKYAEAVCAVHYREKDSAGHFIGGPMYYIKNGLGRSWHWLAWLFAFFGTIAGFGIGNTVQANSVATVLKSDFNVEPYITGIALSVLVFLVIIGGVKRIAHVAGSLVPLMAISYLVIGLAVLLANIDAVPAAIALVVNSAFTGTAATGGFAGAAVWAAMRWGIARGIFSNEAGLGSAPIAHAAAKTSNPVRQGLIAMLGTFFDTIIICSVTGLVIVVTGVWSSGETGASLSSLAFSQGFSGGNYVVSIGLPIFAFTTMLGWSYYGERCVQYLLGDKSILPFRLFWVAAIYLGSVAELNFVWLLADTLNALMALPNLIALFLLSPVVFALTREYFARQK